MSNVILPIPDIPPGLREAAIRGRLIPFVGAGASRIAGCPGWADFADGALRWFIDQGKFSYSRLEQIRHLSPRLKLSLAKTLAEEYRLRIDYAFILHRTDPRHDEKGRRLYRSLSALSKTFVTTNYDKWLDEEIVEQPPAAASDPNWKTTAPTLQRTVLYRLADLTPAALNRAHVVVHLHGSMRDPDSLILTTQDYIQHYANDRFAGGPTEENLVLTFLEHLFQQKTVLFVGYGLEELEILEYVVQKARGMQPTGQPIEAKHYLLQGVFSHEEEVFATLRSYYLRECGILLLPFLRDERDHDQLIEVLEVFARLIPAVDPMVLEQAQAMEALLGA